MAQRKRRKKEKEEHLRSCHVIDCPGGMWLAKGIALPFSSLLSLFLPY